MSIMAEGFKFSEQNSQNGGDSSEGSRPSSYQDVANWSYYNNQANEYALDLSYLSLDGLTLEHNLEIFTANQNDDENNTARKEGPRYLYLQHNRLDFIPENTKKFNNVSHLDLSNNFLTEINEVVLEIKQLRIFVARNNLLGDYSLPKKFSSLLNLEEINLSGNLFKTLPHEVIDIQNLKSLYFGGNQLEDIPQDIWKLDKLEILYLGGNNLKDIPAEMGQLHSLKSLVLCENQLQSLPSTISCLRRLRSLSLHKNQLTTLPPEIVTLKGLVELSLRDNPLVVRFVQDMTYDPPTLRELAARSIKLFRVPYSERDLPPILIHYLKSACRCVNPKCRGVYFDIRVEHIKFVDFCGKYRIPLLQYLCSPRCGTHSTCNSQSDTSSSDDDGDVPESRLRRVLLG